MASNSDKSANSFMPLYGGDYLRDTMHLSAAEDGIYLRLLMHYWHAQRPLPADQRKLAGIARVRDDSERDALGVVLAEFFRKADGVFRNARMDREIEIGKELKKIKSIAGRKGNDVRWGSDRKTSESDRKTSPATATATATALPPQPQPPPKPPEGQKRKDQKPPASRSDAGANGSEAWGSYATAFKARYTVDPVRNAKVNTQLDQLVKRLGAEEAPKVAEFYLSHNSPAYVHRGHSVGMLLLDAEKLRTEWARGKKITGVEARSAEHRDAVVEQIQRVTENMERHDAQK